MSQDGIPKHAGDHNPLLTDFKVRTENSVFVQKGHISDDDFHQSTKRTQKPKQQKKQADDAFYESVKTFVVCCREQRRWWLLCAVGSVCLTLLFCSGLLGYVIHVDLKYSVQLTELRQEIKELRQAVTTLTALCQARNDLAARSRAEVVAGGVDGDTALVLGQGRVPESADAGPDVGGDAFHSSWPQADDRWTNAAQNDDYNGDDDGDDDYTAVDNSDEDDDDDDDGDGDMDNKAGEGLMSRIRRSAGEGPTPKAIKKKKGRKERKGGICRRVEKCKQTQAAGKKARGRCKKILDCLPPAAPAPLVTSKSVQQSSSFTPKAVHYMSDFWNGRRLQEFGREVPLKFLKPADWMKEVYKDISEQPIQGMSDGGFTVQRSGVYLIYSNVMYHEISRHSHVVVVDGHKLFKCMDSVDYVDQEAPQKLAKYKTCAMAGVTHLAKGSRLEVQNLYEGTEIDLSTDATYFGAVLLSPGEIDGQTSRVKVPSL